MYVLAWGVQVIRLIFSNPDILYITERSPFSAIEAFARNSAKGSAMTQEAYEAIRVMQSAIGLLIPAVNIHLRVPMETLWERIRSRNRGFELKLGENYYSSLMRDYDEMALQLEKIPGVQVLEIDGCKSPEEILELVLEILNSAGGVGDLE